MAAPVIDERPEVFMLGSSAYGPRFAAVNGLRAVFAHHMSPEAAVGLLREYRRDFRPAGGTHDLTEPWSAMSVLTFASDDSEAVLEFEAGWALTMQNLARGVREPLRPEDVRAHALSAEFRRSRDARVAVGEDRMVTGAPAEVVRRLHELQDEAQVDEIVLVTPSLDRARRIAGVRAVAERWHD